MNTHTHKRMHGIWHRAPHTVIRIHRGFCPTLLCRVSLSPDEWGFYWDVIGHTDLGVTLVLELTSTVFYAGNRGHLNEDICSH